ncbi:Transcription factor Adf-1 [Trichoplax sp. H2]|nr:Transcription factor Adf-1 [Trichoplax sp. H2]|eukprot:RDD40618.1 Transcription factor Adf-1 [Trichoplax sp. H2]
MQKLTNEEKKRLIHLVERHPILYDTNHEGFSDVKKKDKIWGFIGEALSIHGELARKNWKNLRDSFRKNAKLTSPKNSEPSADQSNPISMSYKYGEEMQFISSHIKPRGSRISNSDDGQTEESATLWDVLVSDQSDKEELTMEIAPQKVIPSLCGTRKRKIAVKTNDRDVQTDTVEVNDTKAEEINFYEGETEMLKFFESIATVTGHFP